MTWASLAGAASQVIQAANSFSPSSVSGLKLWLDANTLTTLFQVSDGTTAVSANNDPVGYWADRSGNGNHVVQSNSDKRPLYKTAVLGSKAVIRFDGIDDYLQSPAFGVTLSQPNTIYFVLKTLALGSNGVYLDTDASGAARHQFNAVSDTYRVFAGATVNSGISVETSSFHIIRVLVNGASTEIQVDTTNTTPGDPDSQGLSGVTLAARFNGVSLINADIAEVLLYNASLSSDSKTAIYDYLKAKWGL